MARRRAGFTLLEVMAAVAVLGLVTVYLARAASEGFGVEGDARRRLQASLLADRVLTELETGWAAGNPVEPGSHEEELEGYRVAVDVEPFDAAAVGLDLAALEQAPGEVPGRSARLPGSTPDLLAPASRGRPAPLSRVSVIVAWPEGAEEQSVARSSFVFDRTAAEPLLESLGGAQGPGAAGAPDGPDAAPPPDEEIPQ